MKRSTAEVQVTHEAELSIHYVFFSYLMRDYITGGSASDEVTSSRAGAQSLRAAPSCCVWSLQRMLQLWSWQLTRRQNIDLPSSKLLELRLFRKMKTVSNIFLYLRRFVASVFSLASRVLLAVSFVEASATKSSLHSFSNALSVVTSHTMAASKYTCTFNFA